MIAAFDVHYAGGGCAWAAAVLFHGYTDARPVSEYVAFIDRVSPYESGQFFRRELPCILRLLDRLDELPHEMIVDGYVMLGDLPGLGRSLFDSLQGRIPVVGVAKSLYREASAVEVFRGGSRRPLYVTTAGLDPCERSASIASMHGAHRIPTLLKRVDLLARQQIIPSPYSNSKL